MPCRVIGASHDWICAGQEKNPKPYRGLRIVSLTQNFPHFQTPQKIIKKVWKRGLRPRALNSVCPTTPGSSGALEDGVGGVFGYLASVPGQANY